MERFKTLGTAYKNNMSEGAKQIAEAFYNLTHTCIMCGEDDKDMSCEKINKK
jgi:hypothetical protein